jgi:orotate phosphoribosyltransferase
MDATTGTARETPRAPDITRDRIFVIHGAAAVLVTGAMVRPADTAPTWVTLVPDPDYSDQGQPPDGWPRERHVRVQHECLIGTVDELVERYREQLTNVFDVLAGKQADGTYAVLPATGEASLDKQTAVWEANGIGRRMQVFTAADWLVRRQTRRDTLTGLRTRLTAHDRDLLCRLAATYAQETATDTWAAGLVVPSDDPAVLTKLASACTTLLGDIQKATQQVRPAPQGGPVARLLHASAYRTGQFVLSSGKTSTEYLDVKQAILGDASGRELARAVNLYFSIHAMNRCHAVAGVETGGALLARLVGTLRQAPTLLVRKDDRTHGATRNGVDGLENLPPRRPGETYVPVPTWLIEDVITTGASTIKAVEKLFKTPEVELAGVLAVVDREEGGLAAVANRIEELVVEHDREDDWFPKVAALTTLSQVRSGG